MRDLTTRFMHLLDYLGGIKYKISIFNIVMALIIAIFIIFIIISAMIGSSYL